MNEYASKFQVRLDVIRPQFRCLVEMISSLPPIAFLLEEDSKLQVSKRDGVRVCIFLHHTLKLGNAGIQLSGPRQFHTPVDKNQCVAGRIDKRLFVFS